MRSTIWLCRATGLAALVALAGCSGGSGDYAQVYGKVTHNGAPVAGASVKFIGTTTDASGARAEFKAETDSSGKYSITSIGTLPGIPPGIYKVTVVKLVMKKGVVIPEDFDQEQLEASGMGENTLPKEYGSPDSTTLSATLKAGENNDVNFDLQGK